MKAEDAFKADYEKMQLTNARQPPRRVRHSELERVSEESDYRVHCPACKTGYLLVQRLSNFWLPWTDRCISCGQMVVYEDEKIGPERVRRPIMLVLRWPHEEAPGTFHGKMVYAVAFIAEQIKKRERAVSLAVQMPESPMKHDVEHVCVAEPLSPIHPNREQNDSLLLHHGSFSLPGRLANIHPWGTPYESMPPWPAFQRIGSGIVPVRVEEHEG
jgi:hypothetical protein